MNQREEYGANGMTIRLQADENCENVLIWLHGGGLEGGDPEGYAFMAEALLQQKTGLALPSYRFLQNVPWPACIEDAAAAAAWVKTHCPGKKILIGGSSAGAYLSMMLCFDGRYLAAHGMQPSDISGWIFNSGQPTTHYRVLSHRGEDSRLSRLDEAAPLYFVHDAGPDAPILILCAEHDMACRVTQNRLLKETLEHFGRRPEDTQMFVLPGYTHCGYDCPARGHEEPELLAHILDFIRTNF